jgi:hypothetical protein
MLTFQISQHNSSCMLEMCQHADCQQEVQRSQHLMQRAN